jgi:hypothetical protein
MGAGDRRGDLAGGDRVDRDPVLAQLERHDLRQQTQPALRGAVRRCARERDVLVHGGDVDDPPALSGVDHDAGGPLRADERAGEVERKHLLPLVEWELEEGMGGPATRVVDEHVESAELAGHALNGVGGLLEAGHVQLSDDRPGAEFLDLAARALGPLAVGVPCDADVEAVARQAHSRRLADAGVGAGDDRRPRSHRCIVP